MNSAIGIAPARYSQGLFLLLVVVGGGWLLSDWIVGGDTQRLMLTGLVVVSLLVSVVTLNDWRSGVYFFFTWLLFEDLVRKYMGNNMYVFFSKDFIVGVTYISFLIAVRRGTEKLFRFPFLLSLSLFFWLVLIQMLNPSSPSYWYGLLGMKLYFYYVPLVFLGYALLRSEQQLQRLLIWNLFLAAIIASLGIIQALLGPEFLNPATLAPEIAGLGRLYRYAPISGVGMLRPNSVFVSDGRFSSFLLLMLVLGLGTAAFLMVRMHRGRRYVLLAIGLLVGAIVLSASRGALVYSAASTLILSSLFLRGMPYWQHASLHRLAMAIRRVLIVSGIVLVGLAYVFPEDVGARWAFYSETLSPDSPAFEVGRRTWDYPVGELLKAFEDRDWLVGHGTGTASLGVGYIRLLLKQPTTGLGVESGFGSLILELGILGPILWLTWSLALLTSSWKVSRQLKGTPFYTIGVSILWFAFLLLLPFTYGGIQPYQNYVMNSYFWLLIGILFRLPQLAMASRSPATPGGALPAHA